MSSNLVYQLADEQLNENELLEILLKKQKKNAPAKLSEARQRIEQIKGELLSELKKKNPVKETGSLKR